MRPARRATTARPRARRLLHDGVGGEVAGAAEVLEQGAPQQVFVEQAIGMAERALLPRCGMFLPRRGTIVPHCGNLLAALRHRRADGGAAPGAGAARRGCGRRRPDRQVAAQRLVARRIVRARVAAAGLAPLEGRGRDQAAGLEQVAQLAGALAELALDRVDVVERALEAGGIADDADPVPHRLAQPAPRLDRRVVAPGAGDADRLRGARAARRSPGAGAAPIAVRASSAATLPNTTASSSEFDASRLAPCAPVADTSPQAHRPGSVVRPRASTMTPPMK